MRLLLLTLCIILFGGNTLRLEAKKHFFSNYNFCHITEEAGLPNNSVTAVMKDSFGYIWVATQDGLARYDGYRFLSYGVKEPLYRLKGNYVYTLCEDRQKRLWVGSDAGLDLIDLQTGLSVPASDLGAVPELSTLFNSFVRSVIQATDGNIWVVTDKMLWCLELDSSGVVTAFYRMQAEADESVSAIAEIEGGLCAGVGNCIYRIVKEGGNKLRKQQLSESIVPFSDDWRISCLQADGDFLWIGSNRGLFRYYRQTKTMKRYRYSSHREGMLSQAYITDMKLTSDGSLVVSTFNGLNVYDRESDTFSFIRRVEDSEERGLNSNIIVCLFTDGQDIWAGTQDGGVNLLYLSRRLEVSRLGDIPWKLSPGRTPQISAVTEDKKGNLWIGTIEGGLYRMNPQTESVQHYAFTPNSSTSIISNNVNGILIDSDNHLWAYTWGAGISELDLNKSQPVFRQHSNGEVPGLEDDFIMSAAEDPVNKGVWFGTTHGLVFYDKKQKRFSRISLSVNEFESVGTMCVDRKNRLWFLSLLLVSVACLSVIFYRYKVRRLKKRQMQLEQLVAQRTHELEVQNHSLEVMAHHVEDMAEEKIRFFTHITHEFRTPVTLIHGPIQQALVLTSNEEVKEQLHIAERNVQDLLALVNELMDFRKLDTEKVKLNIRPFDLVSMMEDLLLPFVSFVKHRHITLQAYYHLRGLSVSADPTYLHRVLTNLLANAVKFTPDGGHIRLYAARIVDNEGKVQLYLSVSDTGCGIPEKDLPQIFDSFFQAQNKVTYPVFGQSGTGIGLNVCKRIVVLHGGVISAKNNRAGGTSFRIMLPMKEMPKEELVVAGGISEKENLSVMEEVPLQKETLLVVDDNHDMRRYIRSLLQKEYKLLEAENGVKAMEILEKHHVDLIISDLLMPEMDGLEFSKRVKENLATSHIPFLILTAVHSEENEKKCYSIGVDEYLCKPFDADIFKYRIRNILTLRRGYQERFSKPVALADMSEMGLIEESRDKVFMDRAMELMKLHYAEAEYGLDAFVRDMGYSKTLVNQKMQSLAGMPIGQFMKNFRLDMGRKLLEQAKGDANVSEVAYAVGFNDPKYFTKCFKQRFGCLPSSLGHS